MWTDSDVINELIRVAGKEGNGVLSISRWSRGHVIAAMEFPMSNLIKERFCGDARVQYWSENARPHVGAGEGFLDDQLKIGIFFPKLTPEKAYLK